MSYNVVQKIRGNYYLYEVTAEWDPETKRSKQKRRYIGKCDKDGNLVSAGSVTVDCRDMGEYYLMFNICVRCGLWDAMCEVYGEDSAKFVFSYSVTRALRNCPPTQAPQAIRSSVLPQFFELQPDASPMSLGGYMNMLTTVYRHRYEVFRRLARGRSAVVYEINALKVPINVYKLFGTRSHFSFDEFPRKSLFMALSTTSGLPFYFRMANYAGTDRSTLKTIAGDLSDMGLDDVTFCLIDGDYDETDIEAYLGTDYSTIVFNKSESRLTRDLAAEQEPDRFESVVHDGVLYHVTRVERAFGLNRCDVYLVLNTMIHEERTVAFYSKLRQFENTVSRMRWDHSIENRVVAEYGFDDLMRFFRLERGEDGGVVVVRDTEEIAHQESIFGMNAVVSNSAYDIDSIIGLIERSGHYEQDWTIFRTDLQGGSSLFPSNDIAVASMMGDFFGSVMKSALIQAVEGSELAGRMNYLDAISAASDMKAFLVNGRPHVNPPNYDQKLMFDALGIEVPSAAAAKPYERRRGR